MLCVWVYNQQSDDSGEPVGGGRHCRNQHQAAVPSEFARLYVFSVLHCSGVIIQEQMLVARKTIVVDCCNVRFW